MSQQINGVLKKVLPVESGVGRNSGKEWTKGGFVLSLDTGSQYPKDVCFTLWGSDKIGDFDRFVEGQELLVSYDMESKESNGRWFTEVKAFRVDLSVKQAQSDSNAFMTAPAQTRSAPQPAPFPAYAEDFDNLPF